MTSKGGVHLKICLGHMHIQYYIVGSCVLVVAIYLVLTLVYHLLCVYSNSIECNSSCCGKTDSYVAMDTEFQNPNPEIVFSEMVDVELGEMRQEE